jgi:hypothetical protein
VVLVLLGLSLAISIVVVAKINKHRLTSALPSACQALCQPQVVASSKLTVILWQSPMSAQIVQPTVSWRENDTWRTQALGTPTAFGTLLVRVSGRRALAVWQQGPDLESSWYDGSWSPPLVVHRGAVSSPILSLATGRAYVAWIAAHHIGWATSTGDTWKEGTLSSPTGAPYGLALASSGRQAVLAWDALKGRRLISLEGRVLPTGRSLSVRQSGTLDFARLPRTGFYRRQPTIVWGEKGKAWLPRGLILSKAWSQAPAATGALRSPWPLWGGWWSDYQGLAVFPRGIGQHFSIVPSSLSSQASGRIVQANGQVAAAWVTNQGFECVLLGDKGWSGPTTPPTSTGATALSLAPLRPGHLLAVWAGRSRPELSELSPSGWSRISVLPAR